MRQRMPSSGLQITILLSTASIPAGATSALAQQAPAELPAIEVTAPSPVKKKARTPRPAPAAAPSQPAAPQSPAAAAPPPPAEQNPFPATVVSEDTFSAVTVVDQREIISTSGQTITESLQTRPGITGTTFAPGANRPIIRGLDSYRVRTQENGIGTHDVAAISEDHAVPIDPNAADRIEVVRGPATLRYGSQAIGGVVAVENQRIPTFMPPGGFSGIIRGAGTSVDDGKEGSFSATAGARGVAVHADGFWRDADDYDSARGTVANSFVESKGGAAGASLIGLDGFFGVSVARVESTYGIPGEEAEEGVNPFIDLEQDKVLAKGEWRLHNSGIDAIRFWFGASDYEHTEFANHEGEGFEAHQNFTNREIEGRVEIQHVPVSTFLGEATGAVGVQLGHRKTRGQAFEGESLLEPARTESIAAFWFEEISLNRSLALQTAARIEHTSVDGRGFQDPVLEPEDDEFHLLAEDFAGERSFTPVSVSLGLLQQLPFGTVGRLTGSYVERAPDAAELFSKGMHEATGTFEIGNPFLDVERATTVEVGLKKARGPFRFDASAYYTRYDGFIFRALQGVACDPEAEGPGEFHCHAEEEGGGDGHDHEALDLVFFQQRDANFYGAELFAQYDVARTWRGVWGIDGQYDFVNARFTNGDYVPRIPPHRLGGGLYYRDANWFARIGVLHAFDQDRFGEEEIATPGYTLLSAEVSYTIQGAGVTGLEPVATIGIKGENLADDEVLNHASFKRREDVYLPGASVRVFSTIKLN